jgi:hypothetical protein
LKWLHRKEALEALFSQSHVIFDLMQNVRWKQMRALVLTRVLPSQRRIMPTTEETDEQFYRDTRVSRFPRSATNSWQR